MCLTARAIAATMHIRPAMHPVGFQFNPTFAFTLLGTFAIYLWTRPPLAAWIWVLPVAAAMRVACVYAVGTFGNYFGAAWISWGTFLGIATLIVLAIQAICAQSDQRRGYMRTFYAGSVFPLLSMVTGYSLAVTLWLRPKTWDPFLLAFDGALGFQPSFLLGRLVLQDYKAWDWTTVIYYALPFSVAMLYGAYRVRSRRPVATLGLFLSFVIIGFAQYGAYPAVGPAHAFRDLYPWRSPALSEIALQSMAVGRDPRNCIPSLHFGAALLVWWNSRIWPSWGRALAGLFLLVTGFSTLALGEHYLIDLVVVFPFALAFQAAWTKAVPWASRARYLPLIMGCALTIAWYVLLRYAIPMFEWSRVLSWLFIVGTVSWSTILEMKLAAAVKNPAD